MRKPWLAVDPKIQEQLSTIARDATVGAGESRDITEDDIARATHALGGEMTHEELKFLKEAWREAVQNMEQP